ncbi:TIGR03862 family flavoprotein [Pannonibacter sp. Pt2]|uniref:TIGR03862 family flavoprotein n=1 Tax=Pannonibacter anstelovis TaxID=3121537 RepID=A0ABU7ZJ81_9HYPH
MTDVVIVGSGPAGLVAADKLSAAGSKVTVLDRMASPARKFLLAGRGGLNLTHSEDIGIFLERYGSRRPFLEPLIHRFDPQTLRRFAENLGQETFVGSSGRVFPKAMKASPLLRAWLARLETQGVTFRLRQTWEGQDDEGRNLFRAQDGSLEVLPARATLLALGGGSWPRLGSRGDWLSVVEGWGVDVAPLRPSNCGFLCGWSPFFAERFAGQPLKRIELAHQDVRQRGEAMISRTGIEGGAVYALSAHLRETIVSEGQAVLSIDLRPDMDVATLTSRLSRPRAKQSLSTFLRKAAGLLPVEVALLRESMTPQDSSPEALAAAIKQVKLKLTDTSGMERAISTAGGIRLDALDDGLMLRQRPGVFAAGEMLDWEAPTGGYLLQACFATGMAAAEGILAYLGSGKAPA